jgi:hypothetical protein
MLSVGMLNVIMLSVAAPILLRVIFYPSSIFCALNDNLSANLKVDLSRFQVGINGAKIRVSRPWIENHLPDRHLVDTHTHSNIVAMTHRIIILFATLSISDTLQNDTWHNIT